MSKIALIGDGRVMFAKNFMKDLPINPDLREHQLVLMDISSERLALAKE